MPNCQKFTDYTILNAQDKQIRNIRFSSDGQSLEIISESSGEVQCTFSINDSATTGLSITGDNLQIVNEISGLNNTQTMSAKDAVITIVQTVSALEIIGLGDQIMGTSVNVRYDAVNDEVIAEY